MAVRLFLTALSLAVIASCAGSSGSVYHTVQKGQTLYQISRVYGVDERYLARINGVEDPTQLRVGDQIFIPGADGVKYVPPTVSSLPRPASPPPASAKPPTATSKVTPKPPAPIPPATSSTAPSLPAGNATVMKGKFVWPLEGKILKPFGTKGGDSSKGIEIASKRGTPVVAAAAGKVTYSGNGIRGFGNLIILKHEESFFTVYAFNDRNLAKTGTYVGQGEKIALSGVPPGGGEGRLHFEIRFGKGAVNPIFYLP